MEGVCYAMRDSLEIIQEMGVPVKEIRLSGGGARGPLWRQLQADIYGQKEACTRTIRVVEATRPVTKSIKTYNAAYPEYQQLYRSLKGDFATIAGLVGG